MTDHIDTRHTRVVALLGSLRTDSYTACLGFIM